MKKWIEVISVCLLIIVFICGCERKNTNQSDYSKKIQELSVNCEVIGMPKEVYSDRLLNYFIITSEPEPVIITASNIDNRVQYKIHKLFSEIGWDSYIPKWNDKCAAIKGYGMATIIEDSKGVFYALLLSKDITNPKILRLYENGQVDSLDMSSTKKNYKDCILSTIALIDNSRMVLQFNDFKNNDGKEYLTSSSLVKAVEYDVVEEKVGEKEGVMGIENKNFDEEGNYYKSDKALNLIVGRKIDSTLNDKAIKCGNSIEHALDINIKNGNGYVLTEEGLYGGDLNSNSWKCIAPINELKLHINKIKGAKKYGVSSEIHLGGSLTHELVKVPGNDKEFYCLQEKKANSNEYIWLHYYEE